VELAALPIADNATISMSSLTLIFRRVGGNAHRIRQCRD
jgi:hypothetical protein